MRLNIVSLTVMFQLPGCHSLKDKRRRLRALRDRFGKRPNVAVSESDFHDQWARGAWQFLVIGENARVVAAECSRIEEFCHQLDAYVVAVEREEIQ